MCGPSGALKDLNNKVQSFAGTMLGEAKTVFGVTNNIVQKLQSKLDPIIAAGPSHMGFSESELSAKRAAAVEAGGTMARNLKGATASSLAAIGGGNTVMPSGGTQQELLDANIAAASRTAGDLNTIEQQGFERGNEDFWKATEGEQRIPGMFQTASGFNKDAMNGLETAQKSQQEIDTASNWWKPLVMKAGMAGLGVLTGGASTAIGGTAGGMLANFGNSMFGTKTPMPSNNSATQSSAPSGGNTFPN